MIRVMLVEDQEIVRRGLRTLLEMKPDLKIVAEAENGQRAIEQFQALQPDCPDVVVMDIRMPVMDGVQATQHLCQRFPDVKILILTTFNDTNYVSEALRFGAKGYLLKDTPAEELAKAIRSIKQGYTQFGPGIFEKVIVQTHEAPKTAPSEIEELTDRERDVLRLVAVGASNREIAQTLHLSEGTVRNHISHILDRLKVRDRTQAALVANTYPVWLKSKQ
ncbi:response regulator transcription factor [Leptolyngbya sp. NIES-2104]|uniref:response regulator transcription factor n=1 Tax=Leptolyngbya sp. NIES-2104 TaxID=1552121 RepID=UPI0006ECB132|nr:response regulator transcription factor [Leptolyngbya sp. NIES-2104]GAP94216.1 two component transcriptional regulator, LuxR family [Leptolyngbya sp. NIES-2104]